LKENLMANTRVLLVEDDLWWGELLAESMQKRGYDVTYYCRAKLVGDNGVEFTDADGKIFPLRAEDFDLVLMDGRLKGSDINGWDVTPRLVAAGLPVIGISGADSFNKLMIEAGARSGYAKSDLFIKLADGELTLTP
jgi:DNA-binding response OmpR family regulator